MVISTDNGLREWNGKFYDDKLTSAVIDRLGHHCHLISSRIEVAGLKIGDSSLEAKQLIPVLDFYLAEYCIF